MPTGEKFYRDSPANRIYGQSAPVDAVDAGTTKGFDHEPPMKKDTLSGGVDCG